MNGLVVSGVNTETCKALELDIEVTGLPTVSETKLEVNDKKTVDELDASGFSN